MKNECARHSAPSWEMEDGRGVDPRTGLLTDCVGTFVNFEPQPVHAGDTLMLTDDRWEYRIAFYLPQPDPGLLYTYRYQPEANWTTYSPEDSDAAWKREKTVFAVDGFVRVCVRRCGGADPDSRLPGDLLALKSIERDFPENEAQADGPVWIGEEAERVANRVKRVFGGGDAAFLLLADTHYAIGCNWPDTARSLRRVKELVHPAGIIHLGDFTDGLLSERWTRCYAGRVLSDMGALGLPGDGCLGNHDLNYFRGNKSLMSKADCARMYLHREDPSYYRDLPDLRLRMIFLDSFDPDREQRYGFSPRDIRWLGHTLRHTPEGFRVLVFSHVPPLAWLHVWSNEIVGSKEAMRLLTRFHRQRGGAVLGWIHGHNHADQVYTGEVFPIISVGCSKLEAFPEHKPAGSVTRGRRIGHPSQELWDVLVLHAGGRDIDLIRYGAGIDRHVMPTGRL